MVRAKFKVQALTTEASWGEGRPDRQSVRLSAVSDEGNKSWSQFTPSGTIEMQITNKAALDQFKVGDFFFVDFTAAAANDVLPPPGESPKAP